jgi:hypothetical protein
MHAGRGFYFVGAHTFTSRVKQPLWQSGYRFIGQLLQRCRSRYPGGAMNSQAEGDEEILAFDIPDEALERAASAERQVTWVYCTNGYYWYDCSWPQ